MSKKIKSTVEEFVESLTPEQKKEFDKEYKEFLISEMILAAMEEDSISVRALAKEAGVSPTIVQGVRSGERENVSLKSIIKILKALGYNLAAEKDGNLIPIKI